MIDLDKEGLDLIEEKMKDMAHRLAVLLWTAIANEASYFATEIKLGDVTGSIARNYTENSAPYEMKIYCRPAARPSGE